MMSWWRRERVALVAAACGVLAIAGVTVWLDVIPNLRTNAPVIEVADQAEIAGQELRLDGTAWNEFATPRDTRSLSVRLQASGGADAESCGTVSLTEAGSDRTWLNARADLDVPFDEGERSCLAEPSGYDILFVFVLPDDVDGPFLLDIEGEAEVARFVIEP